MTWQDWLTYMKSNILKIMVQKQKLWCTFTAAHFNLCVAFRLRRNFAFKKHSQNNLKKVPLMDHIYFCPCFYIFVYSLLYFTFLSVTLSHINAKHTKPSLIWRYAERIPLDKDLGLISSEKHQNKQKWIKCWG